MTRTIETTMDERTDRIELFVEALMRLVESQGHDLDFLAHLIAIQRELQGIPEPPMPNSSTTEVS